MPIGNARSAGICLYRWNKFKNSYEILLGKSESGIEFLGGKKEDATGEATPQTAFREFNEETGKLLPRLWEEILMTVFAQTNQKGVQVLEIPEGKYVLYLVNLGIFSFPLINQCVNLPKIFKQVYKGVVCYEKGLEMKELLWITLNDLKGKSESEKRNFTNIIVNNYFQDLLDFQRQRIKLFDIDFSPKHFAIADKSPRPCKWGHKCRNPHCHFTHPIGHVCAKCPECKKFHYSYNRLVAKMNLWVPTCCNLCKK